jgi:hypothetical protein
VKKCQNYYEMLAMRREKKLLAMKIGMTVVLAASKLSRSFEDASRV